MSTVEFMIDETRYTAVVILDTMRTMFRAGVRVPSRDQMLSELEPSFTRSQFCFVKTLPVVDWFLAYRAGGSSSNLQIKEIMIQCLLRWMRYHPATLERSQALQSIYRNVHLHYLRHRTDRGFPMRLVKPVIDGVIAVALYEAVEDYVHPALVPILQTEYLIQKNFKTILPLCNDPQI
jgi:hypothetical protein